MDINNNIYFAVATLIGLITSIILFIYKKEKKIAFANFILCVLFSPAAWAFTVYAFLRKEKSKH